METTPFTLPELLEQILLHTHPTPATLLPLRLLNRTANLTILSARTLRRILFLDACPPASKSNRAETENVDVELNPLLEKMFPPFMQTHFARLRARADADAAAALGYFGCCDAAFPALYERAGPTVLPSLERAERCRGEDFRWACLGSSYAGPCVHLPVVGRRGGEEHLKAVGEGIWRAMYATRPGVVVHAVRVGACGGVEHVWEVGAGARMGEVMDALVLGWGSETTEGGCMRDVGCDD
ncbi:hypothetical protein P171DRAFT_250090 [Karstenula rhodostoma CBS 690.94]|uniref:Uncharacterized protein n=1 Tax=Karstenula rhodostoma CBS 690.94 TaxID=1392251 RepID=A0A9P4PLK1_9PLEO|nr:hypothetical protein P171DRAFT_250090 [Karstenula rhodostoma CBS 690.94]